MRERSLSIAALLLLSASITIAASVNFTENWESHSSGSVPGDPWYVDPHFPDGGLSVMTGENYTYGGSKSLLLNFAGFNGKDAGIQAKIVPGGYEVQASDAKPLVTTYYIKPDNAQHAEWYLELSLGDVHPPRLADVGTNNPLPAPIPVVAWCKPFITPLPNHKGMYYFDGQKWGFYGYLENSDAWNPMIITLKSTILHMLCLGCRNDPGVVDRVYLGNFDRISIYTRDAEYQEYTVLDELSVVGGNIVNSLTVTSFEPFVSIGPVGGEFSPECKTYTLSNITASPLDWSATKNQNWLTLSADSGTLDAGASIGVDVCINANADTLPQGLFTDAVTFADITNGSTQNRNVELYVGQIDSYTEVLDGSNDLSNLSVLLTPDNSEHSYHACAVSTTQFPTPAVGGTILAVSDNSSVKVTLAQGAQVYVYGNAYSEFYVGANGYITFGEGDTLATGTLFDHFKKRRISGMFTDLAPQSGQVSYRQLMDRVAVTYQNVVKVGTSEANTFQIEMFYDGRIRLTWLNVATTYGIVGLSNGTGIPTNFNSSSFSAYVACPLAGYKGDFDRDGDIDQADFGHMQICLASAPGLIVDPVCANADLDFDGSIGQSDILALALCFSGPNTTPSSACLEFGNTEQ